MSAWQALREVPRRVQQSAPARPTLRRVPSPPRRVGQLQFAVAMVLFLTVGMVGVLLLNTHLQNTAFEVGRTRQKAAELGYRVSDLEARVSRLNAPGEVAGRASELGMVPNPHGVFIDLATGTVVGEPLPAQVGEIPSLRVVPSQVIAAPGEVVEVVTTVQPWIDLTDILNPAQAAEVAAAEAAAAEAAAAEAAAEAAPADATAAGSVTP